MCSIVNLQPLVGFGLILERQKVLLLIDSGEFGVLTEALFGQVCYWIKMTQENRKEEMDCQAPEAPLLCSNDCGHLGSAATKNMCSKCYEDLLKHTEVPVNGLLEVPAVDSAKEHIVKPTPVEPYSETPTSSLPKPELNKDIINSLQKTNPSRNLNRCFSCNKRVGLTGFRCRCGDIFCALHRYSDKHKCSFDYKAAGRDAISKANPLIRAAKIQKI